MFSVQCFRWATILGVLLFLKSGKLLVLVSSYLICISVSYVNLIDNFCLDSILHISMIYACIFDWLWTPFRQRGKIDV